MVYIYYYQTSQSKFDKVPTMFVIDGVVVQTSVHIELKDFTLTMTFYYVMP